MRVRVGSLETLQTEGRLLSKAGGHGVCVFWADGRAYALDDRCPHMGFPLHPGDGRGRPRHLPLAQRPFRPGDRRDARPVRRRRPRLPGRGGGDDIYLVVEPADNQVDQLRRRLAEGLEGRLTLVTAKAVLGLLEAGEPAAEIVRPAWSSRLRTGPRGGAPA